MRSEHELKESAGRLELPSRPPESLVCDDKQTATGGMTLAQTVGEQGEAEACETPLPWEGDYDYMSTVEEDSRLDRECEQLLGDSDLDDTHSMTGAVYNTPTGVGSTAMVPTRGGEPRHQ